MMTGPVVVDNVARRVEDDGKTRESSQSSTVGVRHSLSQAESDPTQYSDAIDSGASSEMTQSAQSDVGSVVSKAKRAASSLWLLLHAQNCRLGGERCPHKGCNDAKLILLHLKTCLAGTGVDCPQNFNGCNQSRKLLSHYRQCREKRTKLAGMHPSRRSPKTHQHACLVCSLVARQARNVLDASRATVPLSTRKVSSVNRKTAAHLGPVVIPRLQTGPSKEDMPPPPPRFSAPLAITGARTASMSAFESPPSDDDLMRHDLSAVAAVAAPPCSLHCIATTDSILLGKSFDSSKTSYMTQAPIRMTGSPQIVRRPRSESLDTTTSRSVNGSGTDYDPTLETELLKSVDDTSAAMATFAKRGRSASMGVLVSSSCGTIVEEDPLTSEDQQFLLDEDVDRS